MEDREEYKTNETNEAAGLSEVLYRELEEGEIIEIGDESLSTDCNVWCEVKAEQFGPGRPYDNNVFRKMRRKV